MKIKTALNRVKKVQDNPHFKKYERYGFLAIGIFAGYLLFGGGSTADKPSPFLVEQNMRDFENSISWYITGVNNTRAVGEICYEEAVEDMDADQMIMAYYDKIKSMNISDATIAEVIQTENSLLNLVTAELFKCEYNEESEEEEAAQ